MTHPLINSLQNPGVKQVVKLQQKAQERKREKRFVTEGRREVSLALQAGYVPESVYICTELYVPHPEYPVDREKWTNLIREVSVAVYNKMAYRQDAEGLIAVFPIWQPGLQQLPLSENPLVIVLEGVEKPGNLGAILRTADAANADAVVICDPQTDIFNPNVIRSSLGCIFTCQVAVCSREEFLLWAGQKQLQIMLASVQSKQTYFETDMKQPLALVFGTESLGLSAPWYEAAHQKLKIPMQGKIDSLNVSASAAILTFEAIRQRQQKTG